MMENLEGMMVMTDDNREVYNTELPSIVVAQAVKDFDKIERPVEWEKK